MDLKSLQLQVSNPFPSHTKAPRHGVGEKFLKGPIPLHWLARAAAVSGSGSGFKVAILLWYLSGLNRSSATVKLSNKILRIFGVKRHAAYRALDTLSRASLIAVSRSPGQCPRVTILPVVEIDGDPDE
jgi:hypothetical protein